MMSGSLLYQNLMDDDPTVDVSQQLGEQLHCWGPTRFPNMTKGAADRSTLNCMQSAAVKDIVETPVTNVRVGIFGHLKLLIS